MNVQTGVESESDQAKLVLESHLESLVLKVLRTHVFRHDSHSLVRSLNVSGALGTSQALHKVTGNW